MTADAAIALAYGFLAYFYLLIRFRIVWPAVLEKSLRLKRNVPDARSFAEFVQFTANLGAEQKADAPVMLRDEAGKLYEETLAANAALDAKATQVLGFLGGGASLYALAVDSKATAHPQPTLLLALGVLLFVLALIACLGCMFTRFRGGLPELRTQLALPATLNSTSMTPARVAAFLFILKQDRQDDNLWINSYKTMFVELAHALFAFGAIAIVLNYVVASFLGGTPATHI
jgi:hypothetical protein